jgi:phosphatidylserine decarboxylase
VVIQFFRHPSRVHTINDQVIIAPADGKVVVIEETEEGEYFKDKRIQVSIFMSPDKSFKSNSQRFITSLL